MRAQWRCPHAHRAQWRSPHVHRAQWRSPHTHRAQPQYMHQNWPQQDMDINSHPQSMEVEEQVENVDCAIRLNGVDKRGGFGKALERAQG